MSFSLLCIIANAESTTPSEGSYSVFSNRETVDISQRLKINTLSETINCCFKGRGQRKRDRYALTESRDILFAHLEIRYRNGAPPKKKTTRNASKQYLAEHTDISLGDSLCLHDYIL